MGEIVPIRLFLLSILTMGRLATGQNNGYGYPYIYYNPQYENYPWVSSAPPFEYYIPPGYSTAYPYYPGQPYYPAENTPQPVPTEGPITTQPTTPTTHSVILPTVPIGPPVWPTGSSKTTVNPVPRWPTGSPTEPPSIQKWPTGETPGTYPTTLRTTTPVWPTGRPQTARPPAKQDWPTGRPGTTRPPSIPVWPTGSIETEEPDLTIRWPTNTPNAKSTTPNTIKWPTGTPDDEPKVTTPTTTTTTVKWPTGPPSSTNQFKPVWPTRRTGITQPPLPEWPTHVAITTPPPPPPMWPTRGRNEISSTTLPPNVEKTTLLTPVWPTKRPKSLLEKTTLQPTFIPLGDSRHNSVSRLNEEETQNIGSSRSLASTTMFQNPTWRTPEPTPSQSNVPQPPPNTDSQLVPTFPDQFPSYPITYIPIQITSTTTPWPTYIVPLPQMTPAVYLDAPNYYQPGRGPGNSYAWTRAPVTLPTTTPTPTPTTTTPTTTTKSSERCKKLCLDENGNRYCCKNKSGECPAQLATCPSQRNRRRLRKKSKRSCLLDTQCSANSKCCLDHCDQEYYCTRVIFLALTE